MSEAAPSPSGAPRARIPEENRVFLVGRLTRDADFRVTQTGRSLCRFDIAVNRRWQNKTSGEWAEDTTFVPIVAWGALADGLKDGGKKGAPVRVEGRLHGNEFTDKTGAKRKVLEIYAFKVEFLQVAPGKSAAKPAADSAVNDATDASASDQDLEEVPF